MSSEFIIITPDLYEGYRDVIAPVTDAVWPEFMLHDPVGNFHWDGLYDVFSSYQFAFLDRKNNLIAGMANSVPLFWAGTLEELPDEGWDWALIKSAEDHRKGTAPNYLCGIQIAIAPEFQGQGLSRKLLGQMVQLAQSKGFGRIIIPVRPSLKNRYPLTPIDSYLQWKTEEGLPFDPWLRVHVRSGGRIIKPCNLAMRITGSIEEWEIWTGMRFFESGEYIIPGALQPVLFDVEADSGEYQEPNVWVVHQVTQELEE